MKNLTIKQLKYFDALAQHNHFGRAAEACAISQPALSMQIKELEESVGAALFERGPRTIRLTRFGEEFVIRIQSILRSIDELGDMARAARGGVMERLRLGVIPTIAPYMLPAVIESLISKFPGMDIHVRETQTRKLIDEINDGRLDAALVALPASEKALFEMPLFEENFVLVRPAGEAEKPVPAIENLAKMRLLLLEEGHCFREQALSFCAIKPEQPRDGLDGSSLTTLVQMVSAGIGVTLIPEMAVPIETRSAKVSISRFNDPLPSRRIGLIWRKTNRLSDQLTQIGNVIQTIKQ
ncbi:hydrogen peroxide-inducible genes activator [Ahrensia marina]|uniref:LysR family transcriptional regulator n=1 Tax=Ahrensia marina TaxID=1514904 RepID=A0A0N0E6J0_9HYPH|nr:hydrogen peroxide-inducible genes activator [Ahrensia marina]KPB00071.1 LysR family transcriptional regulator [Ahrensia marina]